MMITKRFWILSFLVAVIATIALHNMTPAAGQTPLAVEYPSSSFNALGLVTAVEVEGNYAYLGVDGRLMIVDVSDPLKPVKLGETRQLIYAVNGMCTGIVSDVAVSGNYAYVAADSSGLQIVDVSDPLDPTAIHPGVYTSASPIGVAVEGASLVVGENVCSWDSDFQLYVMFGIMMMYDLTNPEEPEEIAIFSHNGYLLNAKNNIVAIAKNYAYTAGSMGEEIIVISTDGTISARYTHADWPNSPVGFTPIGLISHGGYLYVSASAENSDDVLAIFDISDPLRPKWITSFDKQKADAMAIAGEKLYIAHDGTIDAYDLTDPASPSLLFSYVLNANIQDIDAQNNCLYVGTYPSLHVFCTNDPVVTLTPSLTPTSTPSLTPTATPSPSPTAETERRLYLPLIHGYGS